MITLLIKGTRQDAMDAMLKRNIPFSCLPTQSKERDETFAQADDKYSFAVGEWFREAPNKAPYPVGTLLHYQFGSSGARKR